MIHGNRWKGGPLKHHCLVCNCIFYDQISSHRKYCSRSCYSKYRSIFYRWKNSPKWKGEKVKRNRSGLANIHKWIHDNWGKAYICEDCGSNKNVEWSNISNKYYRNREDWKQRCRRCHMISDGRLKKEK